LLFDRTYHNNSITHIFTDGDRVESIRRVPEVATLMVDPGLLVLVSFISPFRVERPMAHPCVGNEEFEVGVNAPLQVGEERDVKSSTTRAAGASCLTSRIGPSYEPPERPELRIDTTAISAEEAADSPSSYRSS